MNDGQRTMNKKDDTLFIVHSLRSLSLNDTGLVTLTLSFYFDF